MVLGIGGGSKSDETSSRSASWNNQWSQDYQDSSSYISPLQTSTIQQLMGHAQMFSNPAWTQEAARLASGAMLPQLKQALGGLAGLVDPRGQIRAQESSLRSGLGNLFRTEIMPAIQSDALMAGGFGGGRQGVAEGVGAGQIAEAYTTGLGDITARANQTATAAASQLPSMAQSLYTAYTAPSMAGLDPLSRLASIIGSPTILSTSTGRAKSGTSAGSTSKSKGESSGWEFNFGL